MLVGVFHYPSGTSYRSWRRGDFLPGLFFTAQFFFTDYTRLGVDPPPPGYRWVRYGPDLLLIDIYTYEVVEVLYGVFYW
ncbi:MAG: RcnB family protein [Proteobacteria bacterium]|nr:RcnB family protein [Pseudomonadota bacterium]